MLFILDKYKATYKLKITWIGKAQDTIKVNMNMFNLIQALIKSEEQDQLKSVLKSLLNKKRKEDSNYDWNAIEKIETI